MAFFCSDISQGSVVTQLRCGEIVTQAVVANLLMNLSVKGVWKSVNIWRSYGQYCSALFFDSQCSSPLRIRRQSHQVHVTILHTRAIYSDTQNIMPTKYFLNSRKTQSMTATLCGCLSKFTILFRVILYTTNIFRVILCPLAPDPGDVTVYVIHLLVLGILPVWSK